MADVTPLASGPLSHTEMTVLAAIPLTSITSTEVIMLVTDLEPSEVESALAHLTRRGIVHRADHQVQLAVTRPPGKRGLRRRPTPPLPAA
jgi:hypothetical protein